MKKRLSVILIFLVVMAFTVSTAYAKTKLLPKGTLISAVKENTDEGLMATVSIDGDLELVDVEYYSYKKTVKLGSDKVFTINLREGRRFGIKFKVDGMTYYALLTADMHDMDFVDPDSIGIDNRDPQGACFTVL